MRTIDIVLFDAAADSVAAELEANGFERVSDSPGRWNFPSGPQAVLYVSCTEYTGAADLPEDHLELIAATLGRQPAVELMADISGRTPADAEVLHLVECILSKYDGVVFDDAAYSHAWTLQEIRAHAEFGGLGFFAPRSV